MFNEIINIFKLFVQSEIPAKNSIKSTYWIHLRVKNTPR